MILIFKYNDKYLKFIPNDENYDLENYANTNLPNGTQYKIVASIDNLTDSDYETLISNSDDYSNNTEF